MGIRGSKTVRPQVKSLEVSRQPNNRSQEPLESEEFIRIIVPRLGLAHNRH